MSQKYGRASGERRGPGAFLRGPKRIYLRATRTCHSNLSFPATNFPENFSLSVRLCLCPREQSCRSVIRASIPSIEGTGGKGVGTMTKIPADSVVTPTELLMESFSPHSLDVKHPFDKQNSLETQPTGRTWQMFLRRGDNMAARLGKTVPFFLLLLPPYDRSILPPPCPRPLSTRFFPPSSPFAFSYARLVTFSLQTDNNSRYLLAIYQPYIIVCRRCAIGRFHRSFNDVGRALYSELETN